MPQSYNTTRQPAHYSLPHAGCLPRKATAALMRCSALVAVTVSAVVYRLTCQASSSVLQAKIGHGYVSLCQGISGNPNNASDKSDIGQ